MSTVANFITPSSSSEDIYSTSKYLSVEEKKDQLAIAQVLSVAGLIAGIAIGIFALIVMPPAAIALICWSVAFSTLSCDFLFYSTNMIEILDDAQLFARCQDTNRYAQQVFKNTLLLKWIEPYSSLMMGKTFIYLEPPPSFQ